MELTKEVKLLFSIFESEGYEIYLVGGCVRDYLLGKKVSDYDLTTNCLPEKSKELLKSFRICDYGLKHGTIKVMINDLSFEITTFRSEGSYERHRRPKQVNFVFCLKEDLKRRDFTINALAYNQKLYDYYDGYLDLKNKLIRCVGDPDLRFNEDALRILRALRFASCLNFKIEALTKKAILANYKLLACISKERITSEFLKLLTGNCVPILKNYSMVFSFLFSNFKTEKLELLNNKNNDSFSRLCLFAISQDNYEFDNIVLSKKQKEDLKLIYNFASVLRYDKINLKKLLAKIGANNTKVLLEIKGYPLDLYQEILENKECYELKQLALKGNELSVDAKDRGRYLNFLLEKVIEEKLPNDHDILLEYVKSLKI